MSFSFHQSLTCSFGLNLSLLFLPFLLCIKVIKATLSLVSQRQLFAPVDVPLQSQKMKWETKCSQFSSVINHISPYFLSFKSHMSISAIHGEDFNMKENRKYFHFSVLFCTGTVLRLCRWVL